jgi:Zn-dependent protease with chaperone function
MTTEQDALRPDVLAYPSPTTSRFLVFLATLLTAGAFIGNWVHGEVLGDEWVERLAQCARSTPTADATDLGAVLESNAADQRCAASVERRRALFSVGGAGFAGAAGLLILFLVPALLERRRRLRELTPALEQVTRRTRALAEEVGLRRMPTVMIGPTTLRDAFTYGLPHRYRIALPPAAAVRWRDASLFDPLIRHELAHLEHHDVPLAWLARSIWWVIAPLLLLPVVVGVAEGDLSLLPSYGWRALLLAVVVQVVSSALLRSREHDADLRAAQSVQGPEAIAAVVRRAREPSAARSWRRALARHPSPAARLDVLDQPERHTRVTLLDGAVTGFLAGLVIPLVVSTVTPLLSGSGQIDVAWVAAALVAGPLLAGSVGLGLCRAALVHRLTGTTPSPAPVAIGVAAGLVLGQAASLAQTGIGTASLGPAGWLPAVAVLGAGATALTAGLAELLADAAPRFRRPRAAWLLALVVTGCVFTPVMWLSTLLETPLELGWEGVNAWLVTSLSTTLVLACTGVVACAALLGLWSARASRPAPPWLIERGRAGTWPAAAPRALRDALLTGVAVGLCFAVALVLNRAFAGPADTDAVKEERLYLFYWMAGCAAGVAALALTALRPPRGAGAAALGATVACVTTVAGWLVLNTALGGDLTVDFATGVARTPLALGFAVVVVVAVTGLLPPRAGLPGGARVLAAGGIALALVAVLASRPERLTPFGGAVAPTDDGQLSRAATSEDVDVQLYVTAYAPSAASAYLAVDQAVTDIDGDTTLSGPARAGRIAREVLPPLRKLLEDSTRYTPASAAAARAHRTWVASLRSAVTAFERFAVAFATNDPAAMEEARAERSREQRYRQRWLEQVAALGAG